MKYMLLFHTPEKPLPEVGTGPYRELFDAYRAATEAMVRAGVLIDCATAASLRGDYRPGPRR